MAKPDFSPLCSTFQWKMRPAVLTCVRDDLSTCCVVEGLCVSIGKSVDRAGCTRSIEIVKGI